MYSRKTDQTATNMGTANGKRKYPDDPTREVFEAARSGNAVLLNEVLQEMNSSERTSALETKMDASLRYGVNEYEPFEATPLIAAAENGHLDCVKILLRYKARHSQVEAVFLFGTARRLGIKLLPLVLVRDVYYTIRLLLLSNGHVDVLRCLVENRADVNARMDSIPAHALMIASKNGHINVVKYLIEHGANIESSR